MSSPDPDRVVESIARRISELREQAGLTQEQVAARLGIAAKNYQRMELGKQNLTVLTLVRVAAALGVHPREFWTDPVTTGKRRPGRPRIVRPPDDET